MSGGSNNSNGNKGVGFTGLLTLVFITLKLLKVIDWSWWWVLSPIWITAILVIVLLILTIISEK